MSVATDPTADPHHGTDCEAVETDPLVIFERPALDQPRATRTMPLSSTTRQPL